MNLLSKCLEQLPNLSDVKRNLPFIITGTVALAIIFFSKQETTGERPKIKSAVQTSTTETKQSEKTKMADKSEKAAETQKQQTTSTKNPEDEEEKKESSEKAGEIHGINHQNYYGDKGGERTSGGGSSRYSNRKNMHTSQHGIKKGGFVKKESNSNDDSEGSCENGNIGKYGSVHPIGGNGLIEHDLFNINVSRYSQGENEEDERGDKMSGNDQISESNLSNHQLKSLVPREKRQKRAPIKINRNFATDTENNEKLQKLKSIVQKEKKLEDKVFFQMFLNIVGTEADEDNDD